MSAECPTCKADIVIVSGDGGKTGVGMCTWCGCKVEGEIDEYHNLITYKVVEEGIGTEVKITPAYRYVYAEECEGFGGPVIIAWETFIGDELVRQVYREYEEGDVTLTTYHGYAGKGKPKA
jgi:hypothetical protein